ncbi:hypothetical protein BDR07DRAFT_1381660 [Suillus spraguei]|nr:hypothetical protein BDR07DRAFT_1381660 [Suillus spraguei]
MTNEDEEETYYSSPRNQTEKPRTKFRPDRRVTHENSIQGITTCYLRRQNCSDKAIMVRDSLSMVWFQLGRVGTKFAGSLVRSNNPHAGMQLRRRWGKYQTGIGCEVFQRPRVSHDSQHRRTLRLSTPCDHVAPGSKSHTTIKRASAFSITTLLALRISYAGSVHQAARKTTEGHSEVHTWIARGISAHNTVSTTTVRQRTTQTGSCPSKRTKISGGGTTWKWVPHVITPWMHSVFDPLRRTRIKFVSLFSTSTTRLMMRQGLCARTNRPNVDGMGLDHEDLVDLFEGEGSDLEGSCTYLPSTSTDTCATSPTRIDPIDIVVTRTIIRPNSKPVMVLRRIFSRLPPPTSTYSPSPSALPPIHPRFTSLVLRALNCFNTSSGFDSDKDDKEKRKKRRATLVVIVKETRERYENDRAFKEAVGSVLPAAGVRGA